MANSDEGIFPVVAPPHQNNATGQPAGDASNMADDDDDDAGWIQALSRREKQRLKKEKKAKQTLEANVKTSKPGKTESPKKHHLASTPKQKEGKPKTSKIKDNDCGEPTQLQQVSWSKAAASLATKNTKVATHESRQEQLIENLKAQIEKQKLEIENLKQQLMQPTRERAHSCTQPPATNTMSFPQSHQSQLPQPTVPEVLLKDPSGIGLFLTQLLEIINSRFDTIQRQIDSPKTRNLDGKRKLEMPELPRNEKMQVIDPNADDTDFSSTDDE
ncbi:hypothetical protein HPB48_025740 [Haemaphysalis longicornis]|uniref:Uncharacterized protein n=1 Tax=Haemaphysalis longicornis TaxID=44386 RepID=A0A9J6H874_HAELO|nr:hypothetical protein HPB48_025740 [Haemaphysalis longicornis]